MSSHSAGPSEVEKNCRLSVAPSINPFPINNPLINTQPSNSMTSEFGITMLSPLPRDNNKSSKISSPSHPEEQHHEYLRMLNQQMHIRSPNQGSMSHYTNHIPHLLNSIYGGNCFNEEIIKIRTQTEMRRNRTVRKITTQSPPGHPEITPDSPESAKKDEKLINIENNIKKNNISPPHTAVKRPLPDEPVTYQRLPIISVPKTSESDEKVAKIVKNQEKTQESQQKRGDLTTPPDHGLFTNSIKRVRYNNFDSAHNFPQYHQKISEKPFLPSSSSDIHSSSHFNAFYQRNNQVFCQSDLISLTNQPKPIPQSLKSNPPYIGMTSHIPHIYANTIKFSEYSPAVEGIPKSIETGPNIPRAYKNLSLPLQHTTLISLPYDAKNGQRVLTQPTYPLNHTLGPNNMSTALYIKNHIPNSSPYFTKIPINSSNTIIKQPITTILPPSRQITSVFPQNYPNQIPSLHNYLNPKIQSINGDSSRFFGPHQSNITKSLTASTMTMGNLVNRGHIPPERL